MSQNIPTTFRVVSDTEIAMERHIPAPPGLVWRALTESDLIPHWWGPAVLTTTVLELDVRPGGKWKFLQKESNGTEHLMHGEFLGFEPLAKLEMTFEYDGAPGAIINDTYTLERDGSGTRIKAWSRFPSKKALDDMMNADMEAGAVESWERLAILTTRIQKDTGLEVIHELNTLVLKRIFNAPPKVVWRCWSEPELACRWWGPRLYTCPVAKIDFRVGGRYLLAMRGPTPDGSVADIWSTGTYLEIEPNRRIVATDSFGDTEGNIVPSTDYGMEGMPLEMQVEIILEDLGGRTMMTLRHERMPDQYRELTGAGWSESFDKLDALVVELAA